MGVIDSLSTFGILYFIGIGVVYYLSYRSKNPIVIPGDIYTNKAGRGVHIPTGGAFVFAVIAFLIIRILMKQNGSL